MSYKHIEDYGVIGDMHSVGLVATDGSLDFLCLPHFDSPTVFGELLDTNIGGSFQINPATPDVRLKQFYVPDTNILLTRFLSADGVGEVLDFMPVGEIRHTHCVVRRVKGVRGACGFRFRCAPRFDYARSQHHIEQRGGAVYFLPKNGNGINLRLQSPIELRIENGEACAEFVLRPDEELDFVLEVATPEDDSPVSQSDWVPRAFQHTMWYWRDWVSRCTYQGRWREGVVRSALVLKLLTSATDGSIAAAATFGLPELVGGERNWDYRYTWIRDASLTAAAFLRLGFVEEPAAFIDWVLQRYREADERGKLQIMYGIDGRHDLAEEVLPHLSGHHGSAPVRVGNAAYDQLQLDIYGELLYLVNEYDKQVDSVTHELWQHLHDSVDLVVASWRTPDDGIWEVRGGRQEFLHSRVACWVALDRAIQIAARRSLPAALPQWYQTRDEIYHDVHNAFWDEGRKAFIQHRGSTTVDASSLLMPLVGFVSPREPRWLSTLRELERELVEDSLVYRYRTQEAASDGLAGTEGTFCMCSYWFIDCLVRSGDLERAQLFFNKMHSFSNHLGLYAEEMDGTGRYLGNFPQAFTHLGRINAALSLDQALSLHRG